MKSLRFTGKDEKDKEFAAALKKNVNNYFKMNHMSTKANAAMIVKTTLLISLYLNPLRINPNCVDERLVGARMRGSYGELELQVLEWA